jgi:hypothetical protein
MKKLKGKDFSFIVCKKDKIKDLNFKNDIEILAENTKFTILASRQDIEEYGGTIGEFPVEWIR